MKPSVFVTSDTRKKVYVNLNLFGGLAFEHTVKNQSVNLSVTMQPTDALRISLGGSYGYYYRRQDQFVSNVDYNNTTRSIVGEVKQKTLRFTGRVNYNITPDLTLQFYGQPYVTRPVYSNFAYVSDPLDQETVS